MLPHPTTSSFSSAIAPRRFSRRGRRVAGGRIVFAHESALKHLGVALAQRGEARGEFVALGVAERGSSGGDGVTVDNAEILERCFEGSDRRAIRLGAALEGACEAEFVDRVGVQTHQLAVAGAADLPR